MADDKIRLRIEVGYQPVPSGTSSIVPIDTALSLVQTEFQGFITRVETGEVKSESTRGLLAQFDYMGHDSGTDKFFGVIEIPIYTPLGHRFFECGPYTNGIWALSDIHRGAIIAIVTPLLYFPSISLGVDAVYSIVLTSIEYDNKNYSAQFLDSEGLAVRGPGGGTVRFDEKTAPEDELEATEDELTSGL